MPDRDWRKEYRGIALTIAALVGLMIAASGLFALGQYQADYVNRQEEGARDRQAAPDTKCYLVFGMSTLCIGGDNDAKAEAERAEHDLQAQQNMAEWARWLTLLTAIQAAIGTLGIFFVWSSLKLNREAVATAQHGNRQSARAALASHHAADAAAQANEIARETSTRQLRAYVGVDRIDVIAFGPGLTTHIEVVLVNSGQTPARELRALFGWIATTDRDGAKFRVKKSPDFNGGSTVEVGAQKTYTVTILGDKPLSARAYTEMRARTVFLVIGGYLGYRDVFKKRHLYVMRGFITFSPAGKAEMTVANKHNGGN